MQKKNAAAVPRAHELVDTRQFRRWESLDMISSPGLTMTVQVSPIMPFPFEYLDDSRGLLVYGQGLVTGPEMLSTTRTVLEAEDRVRRMIYSLVDMTQAANVNVSMVEMLALASLDKRIALLAPDCRVAIVAATELHFGLSRMWEGFVGGTGWVTQVFATRVEAENWLRSELKALRGFEPTFKLGDGDS
jgi:hypothetical protein